MKPDRWSIVSIFSIAVACAPIASIGYQHSQGNLLFNTETATCPAKGPVVLALYTGRADRVAFAYDHYKKAAAYGSVLFISASPGETLRKEFTEVNKDTSVQIDETAIDTIDNARATANWLKAQNWKYTDICIVTDDIHMPRAYFETRLALPKEINIHALPVPYNDADYTYRFKETISLACRALEETARDIIEFHGSLCYAAHKLLTGQPQRSRTPLRPSSLVYLTPQEPS